MWCTLERWTGLSSDVFLLSWKKKKEKNMKPVVLKQITHGNTLSERAPWTPQHNPSPIFCSFNRTHSKNVPAVPLISLHLAECFYKNLLSVYSHAQMHEEGSTKPKPGERF